MRQVSVILHRATGAGIAIGLMEVLARLAGEPMLRVPFVTSIVLAMALPNSEPAQPRAIIGGHVVSAIAGIGIHALIGQGETASATAVGLATLLMLVTRTLHPPAGIDAFLAVSYGLPFAWIANPVLIGAVLLATFATLWRWSERLLFPAAKPAPDAAPP